MVDVASSDALPYKGEDDREEVHGLRKEVGCKEMGRKEREVRGKTKDGLTGAQPSSSFFFRFPFPGFSQFKELEKKRERKETKEKGEKKREEGVLPT